MLVVRLFSNITELNVFLQAGVIGGRSLQSAINPVGQAPVRDGLYRLHGRTLIFNAPASETVTFAATPATEQVTMSLQEIKTQIEAQTTGVLVRWTRNRRLILIESTPSAAGVAIDELGTANPLLGFDTSGDTIGTLILAATTAPFIVSLNHGSFSDSLILVTEE